MARSCGIRLGPRRFELVVLDGGPKKHKVLTTLSGDLPRRSGDAAADAAARAAALKEALKQQQIPLDSVAVAVDTGLGAFRTIKVPFADKAKIEEVIKFEVESHLSQWNIDEVVVDFEVLESNESQSELLVTAVQKSDLRAAIELAGKSGFEPQEMELETTAMVNAAIEAGLCPLDQAQVLIHIGEYSTSVVVVDGGKPREMRAIHVGALSWELGVSGAEGEAAPTPAEGADAQTPAPVVLDPEQQQRKMDQAIKRIRRELVRTISASRTAHPLKGLYLCGYPAPDLLAVPVLDLQAKTLELPSEVGIPEGQHAQYAVAYGAALRQLGGGSLKPSLRREDLRYTGTLERVEMPLAVAALLLVTLLGVWNIFLFKDYENLNTKLGTWRDWTMSFLIGTTKGGKAQPGYLEQPPERVAKYIKAIEEDTERSRFEQMQEVKRLLNIEIKNLEKQLGQDAEINYPQSALSGLALVLDVLERGGTAMGRPSLRVVAADFIPAKNKEVDHVLVKMDIVFFADSQTIATENYDNFRMALKQKPWCIDVSEQQTSALDGGKGISIQNQQIKVDVSKGSVGRLAEATPAKN
jgi:Tfp pilus assembly PilM family ATPase